MARPLLYNFHKHTLPEGIPELLDLIGLFSLWNTASMQHMVYQKLGAERLRWKSQSFRGGTTQEWQRFLSSITGPEHLAIP